MTFRFPPEFDGELQIKCNQPDENSVTFTVTFNMKNGENFKDSFRRMCKEVLEKGV